MGNEIRTDTEAWALVAEHQDDLIPRAIRRVHPWTGVDRDSLHEAAVEALFKAAKTWDPGHESEASFAVYAYGFLNFSLLDESRRQGRRLKREFSFGDTEWSEGAAGQDEFAGSSQGDRNFSRGAVQALPEDELGYEEAEDRVDRSALLPALEAAKATLSPRQLEVIDLTALELTDKVIAEKLGINEKTVTSTRSEAMKKLRAAMGVTSDV